MKRTPAGGGTAEGQAFAFDGAQTTGITTSGTAAGAYTFGYDDNGFLTSSKLVSGAQTVTTALTRDKDGLLTADGPFAIARAGTDGTAGAITGGGLTLALDYDGARPPEEPHADGGRNQRYKRARSRAPTTAASRAGPRRSTATPHTYDYRYDDDGQLLEVERDAARPAAVTERYAYDANGNRTAAQLGAAAAETATLRRRGPPDRPRHDGLRVRRRGFLTARGADTFDYSARGELLSATVGGTTVTYRYDGSAAGSPACRAARRRSTSTAIRATRSRSRPRARPAGVLTTYYYDDEGLLFAFERGGARFFVATDQVGTPRVVTNAAGAVQTVRDYDAFGNLRQRQRAVVRPADRLRRRPRATASPGSCGSASATTTRSPGRWTARDPALYDGGQTNLYAYVGNDPVSQRDPLGLWCVGGSVYDGVGAGAQICSTDEGMSVCFEVGFGVGLDFGVDNGGLPPDGETIVAAGEGVAAGLGVGVGVELDNCGRAKPTGSIDAGPSTSTSATARCSCSRPR